MRRPARHARAAAAGLVALAGLLGACTDVPRQEAAPEVPRVFDLRYDPSTGIDDVDPEAVDVLPAAALRGVLEEQLSWHGVTLVEVMRAAAAGDPSTQVWIDALTANTDAVTQAVGLVYGPVGARAFHQQWAQHTQFLVDYAAATGQGDGAAAEEALAALRDYTTDSGSFFDTATGGRLPADAVADMLATHVRHMVDQLDRTIAGDHAAALDVSVDDHAYLVGLAAAIAGAIADQRPAAFPGELDTPAAEYCSLALQRVGGFALGRLAPEGPGVTDARDELAVAAEDVLGAPVGERLADEAAALDEALRSGDDAAVAGAAEALLAGAARLEDPEG